MLHIVNDCPDTNFPGGLSALHSADEDRGCCLARHAEHTLRRPQMTLNPLKSFFCDFWLQNSELRRIGWL